MNVRRLLVAPLVLAAFTQAASAATLGDAVDAMDAETFAGIAAIPADELALLKEITALLEANRAGVVTTSEAERRLVDLLHRAAEPSALPHGRSDAWPALLELFADGILREARAQVLDGAFSPETPVLQATVDLGLVLIDAMPQPMAGSDGPDSTCFTAFVQCVLWCYTHRFSFWNALCTADCELDFVGCINAAWDGKPRQRVGGRDLVLGP